MTAYKHRHWGQDSGIEWGEGISHKVGPNGMSVLMENGVTIKLTGRNANGETPPDSIPANSVVKVLFGTCKPHWRDIRLFVNPALLEKASVSHAGLYTAGMGDQEIAIFLHAFKSVNLDDYDWLAGVQQID